jgi:ribonuclease T2
LRRLICLLWLILAAPAWAEDQTGDFDYYLLSLSWSPNWCALTGDAQGAEQCDTDLGWSLHGLWPQYDDGWPSYCPNDFAPPSRAETAAMADIMGSGGLAWHQWRKHGSCSGLSPQDYFALARAAYDSVTRPALFRQFNRRSEIPAEMIERSFLPANPALSADMLTVTCKSGHIQEVRVCLSRDLTPRICGQDVIRDCTLQDAVMVPIR